MVLFGDFVLRVGMLASPAWQLLLRRLLHENVLNWRACTNHLASSCTEGAPGSERTTGLHFVYFFDFNFVIHSTKM